MPEVGQGSYPGLSIIGQDAPQSNSSPGPPAQAAPGMFAGDVLTEFCAGDLVGGMF